MIASEQIIDRYVWHSGRMAYCEFGGKTVLSKCFVDGQGAPDQTFSARMAACTVERFIHLACNLSCELKHYALTHCKEPLLLPRPNPVSTMMNFQSPSLATFSAELSPAKCAKSYQLS